MNYVKTAIKAKVSRYNVGVMQKVDYTFIIHFQVKYIPGGSYETEVTFTGFTVKNQVHSDGTFHAKANKEGRSNTTRLAIVILIYHHPMV